MAVLLLAAVAAASPAAPPLQWQIERMGRSAALSVAAHPDAGFALAPPGTTGVTFTNFLARDRHLTNQILLNGSGVSTGDVDGDGWRDLYFCGLDGANALFRNLGGWKFQDVTAHSGVACPGLDSTGPRWRIWMAMAIWICW